MKKFIFKSILFVTPIIVCFIIFETLIRKIPNDYNYKNEYLTINSNKINNLFLGSSHTYYGVNPDFIKSNSFNASHISQSLDTDFKIINKFQFWDSLKTIIIPIDYFSLFISIETSKEAWRIKNYILYYDFYKSNQISNHSEVLSVNLKSNINRIYSYYLKNNSSITCNKKGFGNVKKPQLNLKETGKTAANRHTKKDLTLYFKNIKIIQDIINLANKKNIKILFYTSPSYKTYVSNLNEDQLNLTIKTAENLALKNKNCSYHNLLSDKNFIASDYRDADHLNESGAKKLSLKLDSIIQELQ
ncbi:hypothetical protein FRY74_12600 [Vicingus serpentipes]|uniref:DUF1574 domain-containing protein n=1 Tax=Vicingus serpentipes TaxID=1926625 RepID=A0A5C6RNZ7_9FLAO|nr:hypothetical protein [Vicingus serpentipes]TXB63704.1 hypothetical protein FRY74_12600 [Vicingus serpentipes]